MRLAAKLNLKSGMKLQVVARPRNVDLDDVVVARSGAVAIDDVWSAMRFRAGA
jgi:hypothetical protein